MDKMVKCSFLHCSAGFQKKEGGLSCSGSSISRSTNVAVGIFASISGGDSPLSKQGIISCFHADFHP